MKVKLTQNYSMFNILVANRNIIPRHVDTMVASIQKMGIIRPMVICETNVFDGGPKKKYILDGQHLEEACRRLDTPVPYVIVDVKGEEDIISKIGMLNSSSKSWNLGNYIDAYKTLKSKTDYRILSKLRETYNVEYSVLAALCTFNTQYDSVEGTKALKIGTFEITNLNYETNTSDYKKMCDTIPNVEYNFKRKLLRALISTEGIYKMNRVIANLHKHKKTLELMGSEDHSIEFIQTKIFEI